MRKSVEPVIGWRISLGSVNVSGLRPLILALVAAALAASCSGGLFKKDYEYEEELYLSLDGSATVQVNASVASLVALRGATLDVDPDTPVDREAVRALFRGEGDEPRVTVSRRRGRRFVHVRVDVDRVEDLSRRPPLSWSTYRFDRRDDMIQFRQRVGPPAAQKVGQVGWTGDELVAFRAHLPSEIPFHNSPNPIRRGNILEWEQPLTERLAGVPLELEVHLETESILATTLLLFGATILAAAGTFGLAIWLLVRRGRRTAAADGPPVD
jgi:hypothetical protein